MNKIMAYSDTGKPGEADPIETHVYLQTSESDGTAREMFDISEKTVLTGTYN